MTIAEKIKARAKCHNVVRNYKRRRQAILGGWGQAAQQRAISDALSDNFKDLLECEELARRAMKNV